MSITKSYKVKPDDYIRHRTIYTSGIIDMKSFHLLLVHVAVVTAFHFMTSKKNCLLTRNSSLRADCTYMGLTHVPQKLDTDISILDLSNNLLSVLKDEELSKYWNLEELYIDKNNISNLQEKAFWGMENLRILSLSENKLEPSLYSEALFKPLVVLQELYLHRNLYPPSFLRLFCKDRKCSYSGVAFGMLKHVRVLWMDLCEIPLFEEGFENMTQLNELTFDYCLACTFNNKTFHSFRFANITVLNLGNCKQYKPSLNVETGILEPFQNVTDLDLSNSYFSLFNALQLLYPFQGKRMNMINFHRVSRAGRDSQEMPFKVTLTSAMMTYLRTICVKTVILSFNGIVDFQKRSLFSFDKPECIVNLILSANSFGLSYNAQYMDFVIFSAKAVNLKVFDYSYVALHYSNQKFILPSNFDFAHNKHNTGKPHSQLCGSDENHDLLGIGEPPNATFFLPRSMEFIRLSHILSNGKPFSVILENTESLKHLDLSYCHILGFPDVYLPGKVRLKYLDISGINSLQYIDKHVTQVSKNTETVILRNANINTITRQGKNILSLFSNVLKELDLSQNHLESLPYSFDALTSLTKLNLSFNSFRHFPESVEKIKSMKLLDFRYNRISALNDETMQRYDDLVRKANLSLLLDGNDFYCWCENRNFMKWLGETKVQLDKDGNYTCRLKNGTLAYTSKVLDNYHELFSQCDSLVWLRVGVICIVSSFVIVGISAVVYQFRWRMAYFIYRKLRNRYINNFQEYDFLYDVFVAYANDSTTWLISTFVPRLESEWNLRVCVKDRDFPVGSDRMDTVTESIRNSKSVVFVITPIFIQRKWGRLEIEMAKYEMFEHRQHKRIIVILKGGTRKQDIPGEFNLIWKDIVLIEWPTNTEDTDNFWYNLRLQLQ